METDEKVYSGRGLAVFVKRTLQVMDCAGRSQWDFHDIDPVLHFKIELVKSPHNGSLQATYYPPGAICTTSCRAEVFGSWIDSLSAPVTVSP